MRLSFSVFLIFLIFVVLHLSSLPLVFSSVADIIEPVSTSSSTNLSIFPPLQQHIRLQYLRPEFLTVPFLPSFPSSSSSVSGVGCPCHNASLCVPVGVIHQKEIFIFQVKTSYWEYYDWTNLTTIVITTPLDPGQLNTNINNKNKNSYNNTQRCYISPRYLLFTFNKLNSFPLSLSLSFLSFAQLAYFLVVLLSLTSALLCYAHAHSTRISILANLPASQLSNNTYRQHWIDNNIQSVVSQYIDGINVDFEEPLSPTEAPLYTSLLKELGDALHSTVKGSQLSVDVAWSPLCIDNRCYDAAGIANVSDLLFVMSYDLRSQIYDLNDCQASANAPIERVMEGVLNYIQLGIQPYQLILGVPWYSYDYSCIEGTHPKAIHCPIKHIPYQGAPCSDAAGKEIDFYIALHLLQYNTTTGRHWNSTFETSWFNYVDSITNITHQVWMDDVHSLSLKYKFAHKMGLRGTGMWTADSLNYSLPISKDTRDMWQALKIALGTMEQDEESTQRGHVDVQKQ